MPGDAIAKLTGQAKDPAKEVFREGNKTGEEGPATSNEARCNQSEDEHDLPRPDKERSREGFVSQVPVTRLTRALPGSRCTSSRDQGELGEGDGAGGGSSGDSGG